MSKYDALWIWLAENGQEKIKLTFSEIEQIIGIPIDHSFLTYKNKLLDYGYNVKKISKKNNCFL